MDFVAAQALPEIISTISNGGVNLLMLVVFYIYHAAEMKKWEMRLSGENDRWRQMRDSEDKKWNQVFEQIATHRTRDFELLGGLIDTVSLNTSRLERVDNKIDAMKEALTAIRNKANS